MTTLSITILGQPASKSNSRKKVYIHGKPRFIKSERALIYSKVFKQQCLLLYPKPELLKGDVILFIKVFYGSRRPDLDESLIMDLLQGVAYDNDRQVKEKHIYWGLDRDNPRCIIHVRSQDLADRDCEAPWLLRDPCLSHDGVSVRG